jgi:Domain of Unknown Function (DUF1080)
MRRCIWLFALAFVFTLSAARAGDDAFFNGKDLTGWDGLIKEYWSVQDGAIVGTGGDKTVPFNTFLCSKKKYKDFELSFQVRLKNGKGNSGVQIRSFIDEKNKQHKERFAVSGPQADIGEGYWGSLYGENFGGMMKEAPAKEVNAKLKKDDFNDYFIKCVGKHVTIKVNGVTSVDADFPKMPEEGIIAWQLHGGHVMEVAFKNIQFKELK